MFIHRNVLDYATQLQGLSLIDRIIIDLEHNKMVNTSVSHLVIHNIFAQQLYPTKSKKALLTYLAVKMHQIQRFDDVNLVIQYGLQHSMYIASFKAVIFNYIVLF